MRLRLTFSKTSAMRFTGHLDLFSTLERTMRRANLPLAYSQGFNPRPKITLASALPLGFTSDCELADIWLENDVPVEEVASALKKAAPPGIEIHAVEALAESAPKPQTELESSEFLVTLLEPVEDLTERVEQLLAAKELPRERVRKGKKRTYDLRELIGELEVLPQDAEGNPRLRMRLAAREGATGRPEEALEALGLDPLAARYHRTRLLFAEREPAI